MQNVFKKIWIMLILYLRQFNASHFFLKKFISVHCCWKKLFWLTSCDHFFYLCHFSLCLVRKSSHHCNPLFMLFVLEHINLLTLLHIIKCLHILFGNNLDQEPQNCIPKNIHGYWCKIWKFGETSCWSGSRFYLLVEFASKVHLDEAKLILQEQHEELAHVPVVSSMVQSIRDSFTENGRGICRFRHWTGSSRNAC